jgi:hypothetical protein
MKATRDHSQSLGRLHQLCEHLLHSFGSPILTILSLSYVIHHTSLASVNPLLVPYALRLLGVPLGVPLIFAVAALAWFGQVVLVVSAR